jgi:hypothetical protein
MRKKIHLTYSPGQAQETGFFTNIIFEGEDILSSTNSIILSGRGICNRSRLFGVIRV